MVGNAVFKPFQDGFKVYTYRRRSGIPAVEPFGAELSCTSRIFADIQGSRHDGSYPGTIFASHEQT